MGNTEEGKAGFSSVYSLTEPRIFGLILSEWYVTPREVYPIMDALRIFVDGWEHPEPIEPIALLSLLVNLVRGQPLSFIQPIKRDHIKFREISWKTENGGTPSHFLAGDYLSKISPIGWDPLRQAIRQSSRGYDPATNFVVGWLHREAELRQAKPGFDLQRQSHFADYIPRVRDLARFIEKPDETDDK